MALTRIFGGKRYKLHGAYAKKSDAKRKAVGFRLGGEPARVVEESGYWLVYFRKAKKKRKTRKKSARVEAYTFGEAQAGRGHPW